MNKHLFFGIFVVLFLSACTSKEIRTEKPVQQSTESIQTSPQATGKPETPEVELIDEPALQRSLGLEKPDTWLGYTEKAFNTCQAGYGYSSVHNCRQRHFIVIHFQLLCRDSEGTVSEVVKSVDMIKNAGRKVRWSIKNQVGAMETDGLGYAQIRMISSQSQKLQRLKLAVENDFLYLRAGDVAKIVTPRSWCR